jgi:hypothetical protein
MISRDAAKIVVFNVRKALIDQQSGSSEAGDTA